MGTARMGSDPKQSVVDRDLRSQDRSSLFVLGSAVFPTSATANPTLTIAALRNMFGTCFSSIGSSISFAVPVTWTS